jgi:hypothetical protein
MHRYSRNRAVVAVAGMGLLAGTAPAIGMPGVVAPPAMDAAVVMADGDVVAWESAKHTFGLDDVIGNALGETDGDNPNVIKDGDPGESLTGEDNLTAKDGGVLYPINSEFGFDVTDFVGATPKTFDGVAEEGWVGAFTDDDGSGLQFSDAETATLKAPNLVGTWAAGLGGNEIKASTEHFTVMEAVLSCYQTVPYDYWASEEDYSDNLPSVPDSQDIAVCAANQLPNPVTEKEIFDAISVLVPNEDSVIPNPSDLYLGTNYSVTEKDDGKVLYRWGQAVKRPTDIRFATSLALPAEFTAPEAAQVNGGKGYKVTRAELVLKHAVTNNPNDQIRPEDWENEGATGDLPDYTVNPDGQWISTKACYEGDGDFIPEGTVLRDPAVTFPGAMSSDLLGGFSNAWYTTIDRDPFAWSYEGGTSPTPSTELGELISGPRWRMLSNKFGQDIPSLEIPAITCDEPPYEKGTVKYEVGKVVETTINLLDWSTDEDDARWLTAEGEVDAQSPFAYSAGWTTSWSSVTAADYVPGQKILEEDEDRCDSGVAADGSCVTALGTKLTPGFDVAFYVKGDKKPLKVYDVFIRIEYEGGTVTPPATTDFGDAPDTYGTTAEVRTTGDAMLGETVDPESVPEGPLDGTGDDVSGTDDEDGVEILAPFAVGSEVTLPVVWNDGVLDAKFDWNADGDFADDGELVAGRAGPGTSVTITVPDGATAGPSFARFVVTKDGAVPPIGEVEDYKIVIAGYDFGDLPKNYGDGDDPARHLTSALSLRTVDVEGAAKPTPLADGDDLAGTDDEDGVNLSSFVVGKSSTIRVTATAAGKLNAWIDWNADGDFGDLGEQVATDLAVRDGTIAFKAAVPVDAAQPLTFARFRVSEEAGLGVFGPAQSGEVEDYPITITGKGKPTPTP